MIITRRFHISLFVALLALGVLACQDPTTLGTDLLSEDQAKVGFTDTLTLSAKTVTSDSVRTYSDNPANQLRSYLFGDLREPLAGKAESSIYAQLRPAFFKPDFSDAVLDSVVLVLPYDTGGVYGDLEAPFGMEVLRMVEPMDRSANYYSYAEFATDPSPLARETFTPSLDSIEIIEYSGSGQRNTESYPHLRVHLSPAFGSELLQLDTFQTASDSAFLEVLDGIHIRPSLPTPGLLSFSLNESSYLGGVYLYYTQDTTHRQFQFGIDQLSARVPAYEMDYTGSVAASLLDDPEQGDSLMLVQGMNGLNARLEIGDLEELNGLIINKAELELKLRDHPANDTLVYPPVTGLVLSYENESGGLELISDVLLGINLNQLETIFGGRFDRETGTYTMNLTSHLQSVISGDLPPVLVISAIGKTENANRSVLYGPGHPEFGVKLRVAYTEL